MISITMPRREPERYNSLDLVRGIAVLGIFLINIHIFASVYAEFFNPKLLNDTLSTKSYFVYFFTHLFADGRFIALFSMLFGVGIVLITDRVEKRTNHIAVIYYRRTTFLILMGLLHAYLLWFGDVLFMYGVIGLVLFWCRRASASTLLILAISAMAITASITWITIHSLDTLTEAEYRKFIAFRMPDIESVKHEIALYRGSWLEQLPARSEAAFSMQTEGLLIYGWHFAGLMLLGMFFYRIHFVTAELSNKTYLLTAALGIIIGGTTVAWGVWGTIQCSWSVNERALLYDWVMEYGIVVNAIGYMALILWWSKTAYLQWLQSAIMAVGRMALSNYILQTLIATWIFYGHGLGLFAGLSFAERIPIVLLVWVFQLIASPFWLRYFLYGPLEWLWRCFTYWRWMPMRAQRA